MDLKHPKKKRAKEVEAEKLEARKRIVRPRTRTRLQKSETSDSGQPAPSKKRFRIVSSPEHLSAPVVERITVSAKKPVVTDAEEQAIRPTDHTAAEEIVAEPGQPQSAEKPAVVESAPTWSGIGTFMQNRPEVRITYTQPEPVLPQGYGDNHVYLMVRDPYWLFAYWELQDGYIHAMLDRLGGNWHNVTMVLRLYNDDSGQGTMISYTTLPPGARQWYLNAEPNHSFFVEIGLLHRDGRYVALVRSNKVQTPRAGMSEVIDEQWMGIDFDKMYALSGGFEVGKSSQEMQKLMQQRLQQAVSSGSGAFGGVSSMSSPVRGKQRGFWFILDCELIVYGATEPDAKVTMQGHPIRLRPDGTFTMRFALPDGNYVLDAKAMSADGLETRTIIPVVNRHTETPEPVVLPA